MNGKNKHFIMIISFICALLILFYSDNQQQKRFNLARSGFMLMQEGKYEEAILLFDLYREECNGNVLYWKLVDMINDGTEYTRKGVQNAKDKCIESMNMSRSD